MLIALSYFCIWLFYMNGACGDKLILSLGEHVTLKEVQYLSVTCNLSFSWRVFQIILSVCMLFMHILPFHWNNNKFHEGHLCKQFLKLRSESILKHDKYLNVPILPFFFLFSPPSHWEGGSEQRAVRCWAAAGLKCNTSMVYRTFM